MTTAAVMQPTYLPWLGYLDLMDQVDTFVLLDTVQFDYRSWQHRNRIPGPGGEPTWLSVPVTKATRRAADHRGRDRRRRRVPRPSREPAA